MTATAESERRRSAASRAIPRRTRGERTSRSHGGCSCGGSGACHCPSERDRERERPVRAGHSLAGVRVTYRPAPESEEELERPRRRDDVPAPRAAGGPGRAQLQPGGPPAGGGPTTPALGAAENVWGVPITARYCHCLAEMVRDARWARRVRDAYRACAPPVSSDVDAVESCVDAALPGAVVAGTTTPGAAGGGGGGGLCPINCDRPPGDCGYLSFRKCLVHETMHRRTCLDLNGRFPVPADFDREWNDPQAWVDDEVNSYTWERRFALDVVRALNRICAGARP
jgi:hypothetical protein